jgi:Tfp pilus assembly protein PilF
MSWLILAYTSQTKIVPCFFTGIRSFKIFQLSHYRTLRNLVNPGDVVYSLAMIAGLCRFTLFVLAASLGLHAQTSTPTEPAGMPTASAPAAAPDASSTMPSDPAAPMLKKAYELLTKKDLDGALHLVDEAVKDNPKSFAALTLRGMIYSQKKDWTSAEADFQAALAIDPTNMVVKFNLGEIKFVQKDYAAARARFLPLTTDPVMGDFASYKVFLCDLFGGQEAQAQKELSAWNEETGPSYYYGTAAWDLVHKDTEGARSYLVSASGIFPASKNQFYAASLRDLGYLPLPQAPSSASN